MVVGMKKVVLENVRHFAEPDILRLVQHNGFPHVKRVDMHLEVLHSPRVFEEHRFEY